MKKQDVPLIPNVITHNINNGRKNKVNNTCTDSLISHNNTKGRKRNLSQLTKLLLLQETSHCPCIVSGLLLLKPNNSNNNNITELDNNFKEKFEQLLINKLISKNIRFRSLLLEKEKQFIDLKEKFDIKNHVHFIKIENSINNLNNFINKVQFSKFDENLPKWNVFVIEGLEDGIYLFWKIHHWIADGQSLAYTIMIGLTDNYNENSLQFHDFYRNLFEKRKEKAIFGQLDFIYGNCKEFLFQKLLNFKLFITIILLIMNLIFLLLKFLLFLISFLYLFFTDLIISILPEKETIFKPNNKERKITGQLQSSFLYSSLNKDYKNKYSLKDLKKISKITGATINELFLTLISMTCDKYRLQNKDYNENYNLDNNFSLKVGMGVNIREPPTEFNENVYLNLGNYVGIHFLNIPQNLNLNIQERILQIKNYSKFTKYFPQDLFHFYLLYFAGTFLPECLSSKLFQLGTKRVTFGGSNVFIPKVLNNLKILDYSIERAIGFIPLAEGLGINFMITSYNDQFGISVVVDKGVIGNVGDIIELLNESWEEMKSTFLKNY
ncbi:hypothetical protein ABK040_012357 [Willaertia magna]